jgi:hypothetical protein
MYFIIIIMNLKDIEIEITQNTLIYIGFLEKANKGMELIFL